MARGLCLSQADCCLQPRQTANHASALLGPACAPPCLSHPFFPTAWKRICKSLAETLSSSRHQLKGLIKLSNWVSRGVNAAASLPRPAQRQLRTHIYTQIFLRFRIFFCPLRETVERQLHPKELRSAQAPNSFLPAAPSVFLKPRSPSRPWESSGEETLLATRPGALQQPSPTQPDLPGSLCTPSQAGRGPQPHHPLHHRCSHRQLPALPSKTLQSAAEARLVPGCAGTLQAEQLPRRKSPTLPAARTSPAPERSTSHLPDASTDSLQPAKHQRKKDRICFSLTIIRKII